MERLTYDFAIGENHCWEVHGADNLTCEEVCKDQGDNGCENCPIRKAIDRLAAYENTGLRPEEVKQFMEDVELRFVNWVEKRYGIGAGRFLDVMNAEHDGRLVVLPFVAMVEQSLQDGEMKPQRDQRFNGRYAVVYSDKKKWASPLIDICGRHYDREQAEARLSALTCEEAEAALKEQEG